MIDNFELLKPILTFDEEHFYWCQLIKRRKENEDQPKGSIPIAYYFLGSEENWDAKTQEIREVCTATNARAYLNINKRNWKKVALLALKYNVDFLSGDDFRSVKNAYTKACGNQHSEKRWIVDVDHFSPINTPFEPLLQVPTPNGYHLITNPFDRRLLTQDVDIHKDNPTVAFAP